MLEWKTWTNYCVLESLLLTLLICSVVIFLYIDEAVIQNQAIKEELHDVDNGMV